MTPGGIQRLIRDVFGGTWPAACEGCGKVDAHPIVRRSIECRRCGRRWGRVLLETAAANHEAKR